MAETDAVEPEYRRYVAEIDLYEKEFRAWESRGKKILKLYKDASNDQGKRKRFNVLWSNVQTLLPACYARDPQPVAERRFKDSDPIGRTASEVLERCLSYTIDCQDFGTVMRQVVGDRLLPGRGVAWTRYQADIETQDPENEDVSYEQVIPDYVYWEDFGHNVARTWGEVTMVWRKVYLTRAKLVKRFGDVGQTIPLDYTPKGLKDEKVGEDIKKACIYWIVDKDAKQVVFLSKSHPKVIESKPDKMSLTNGFPCPRPLCSTLTTDSLVPVPDYALYQTQAQELEELTARINALQKALKLVGVYDANAPALANLLNDGYENKLLPVDQWSQFSEKGGLDGAVDFLPIKEIAETLIGLYEAREKSKADLYEITGIADIIRGNSEPNETATAQQIKGRFAVLRISDTQQDVQRYARDLMRIMGEIIAEHFSLETIKAICGIKLLHQAEKEQIEQAMQQHAAQQQAMQQQAQQAGQQPQQQPPPVPPEQLELMSQPTWEEVYGLISNQVLREFRIDIETDSTIRTDEDADREQRTEFLQAAGGYIQNAMAAMEVAPEMGPLLGELLMFGVRSHRAARSLEPVFEDALKKLEQRKPAEGNPEMAKVQGELQVKREEMQMKAQAEQAIQQAQHEQEMARQQMEDQRAERDSQRQVMLEREKGQITMQVERYKAELKAQTDLAVAKMQLGVQTVENEASREAESEDRAEDRKLQERVSREQTQSKERIEKSRQKAAGSK